MPDRIVSPGLERSLALRHDGASSDRFVLYGLAADEVARRIAERGHETAALFRDLEKRAGPAAKVLFGADGSRTKLYWCLDGDDPCMIGVDLVAGRPPAFKRYGTYPPQRATEAVEALDPRLRPLTEWLLAQRPFSDGGLLELSPVSRIDPVHYTGVDLGILPDWEKILMGEREPLWADLCHALLDRAGLAPHHHLLEQALFEGARRAFTSYLGFRIHPDGSAGVNIYAFPDVTARLGASLGIAANGARAWPVAIYFRMAGLPEARFRLRRAGPEPRYAQVGQWLFDYQAPPAYARTAGQTIAAALGAAEKAAAAGSPGDPLPALRALRGSAGVATAWVAPDQDRS